MSSTGEYELATRAEWLSVFEVWLAARFRLFEFSDVSWTFRIDELASRVLVGPSGARQPELVLPLPADFMMKQPYLVAAHVAAEARVKAEALNLVPRRDLEALPLPAPVPAMPSRQAQ